MEWVYPVPDTFGLHVTDPFGTRRGSGIHEGTDYRAWIGTELYAIADGVIESIARNDPRGGNYVRIRLDSGLARDARYSHLSRIDVVLGQRVRARDRIGLAGDTGNVTAAHLHFGMTNNAGGWIDPHAFLRARKAVAVRKIAKQPTKKEEEEMTPTQMFNAVWHGGTFEPMHPKEDYGRPKESPARRLVAACDRAGRAMVLGRRNSAQNAAVLKAVKVLAAKVGMSEAEIERIVNEGFAEALSDLTLTLKVDSDPVDK